MEENSWVSPSCKTFCIIWIQHRVKLTPSYLFYLVSLCEEQRGWRLKEPQISGQFQQLSGKNPKFLGSSNSFHERTPNFWAVPTAFRKEPQISGQFQLLSWKNPKFLGSSDGFHERTPNFWAVPTAFMKEPQISGQFRWVSWKNPKFLGSSPVITLEPVLWFSGNSS
jgi:hypothetical protein